MLTVAEFLINSENEYNGHKQADIGYVSLDTLLQIVKDLEDSNPPYLFTIQLFYDKSGSIEQKDYWEEGERPDGQRDRLIASFAIVS